MKLAIFLFILTFLFVKNSANKDNRKNAVKYLTTPKHLSGQNSVVKAMGSNYYFIEACCMDSLPVNQACKRSLDRFHLVCKEHLGGHPGDCKRRASVLYYEHCSDIMKRKQFSAMQPYYGYHGAKVTIEGRRQDPPYKRRHGKGKYGRKRLQDPKGRRHSRLMMHQEMDKDIGGLREAELGHRMPRRRHRKVRVHPIRHHG